MHKQRLNGLTQLAVIMLMLSLIVTAMVQVISVLTDLRGRNLTSGLHNLLEQIEPGVSQAFGRINHC